MNSSIKLHSDADSGVSSPPVRPSLPQWLVSVRDDVELTSVIAYDVNIVDLKEPNDGALAPTKAAFWEVAVKLVERTPAAPLLSAALGEREQMQRVADSLPGAFSFAKVGPSGCRSAEALCDLWQDARNRLPKTVELVAVAYADAEVAKTLPPEEVFTLAAENGFKRCLIDTFQKTAGSTTELLGRDRLERLGNQARDSHLWWALAGSLRHAEASRLLSNGIQPNCFGVRGDVCVGDRKSVICPRRMTAWSEMLRKRNG